MCGIAGMIDLSGDSIDPVTLVRMNAAIRHRGRDDEGYVLIDQKRGGYLTLCGEDSSPAVKRVYPQVSEIGEATTSSIGLAHRRFSIIDLSSGGHQPFFSGDKSCCVVFNGEIYNYVEVRRDLADQGCAFHTASDTEVLVESYRKWGTDCFRHLNGFWAAAIYDFERRQLILSRDRLGKKPLYWTKRGTRIFFASEIKALLEVEEIAQGKRVNESAAYLWLAYGLRDMDGLTLFEGIHSLPSASWAIIDREFPNSIKRYWQVPSERLSEAEVSVAEACRSVKDLLRDAIRIRLRADVPWAVELSGGMDSSVLVSLARELHSERVSAYTVRFPDEKWNEEPFARSVANFCSVDYHVLEFPLGNFWMQILPFTRLQEEPYHAPNLATNQAIWTLMRAANTKVSLNGAAGDELFAGYARYFTVAQIENCQHGRLGHFLRNALHWTEGSWFGEGLAVSLNGLAWAFPRPRQALPIWRRRQVPRFIKIAAVDRPSIEKTLTQVLHSDMTNTIMPYWLRSSDKTFMGVPFEVRAPFLDYRLVEHVSRLPSSYLIRDGWHKWILREAMKGLLPDDVLWRKKKMGFPFPYERFWKESEPILQVILKSAQNPFIDFSKQDYFKHDWRAISFVLWYERFFNNNTSLFRAIEELGTESNTKLNYGYTPEFLLGAEECS